MINRKFIPVNIAVLTVSDTRTDENDRSGDVLAKYINDSGHFLKNREILKDDRAIISSKLTEWCKRDDIDVIITTGGTGLTGRDVSVEAHRDIYEKEIDAFATMFTIISMKKLEHLRFNQEHVLELLLERIFLHCRAVLEPVRTGGKKF